MLQHDNARPHVTRICTQFLEAENIPVLAWPAYSPDMSPIEYVWDALDRRIRQRVPGPANIQQLFFFLFFFFTDWFSDPPRSPPIQ
uniref:Tc1-like transposase DDE domain-containing protein n=1 Tax=Sander lucioperca TaxID=283035 RepID=A0A8C9XA97_SANLU